MTPPWSSRVTTAGGTGPRNPGHLVASASAQPGGSQAGLTEAQCHQAVVTRDDQGGVIARAVRLLRPSNSTAVSTTKFNQSTPAIDGFLQAGTGRRCTASERTEAWIFFDDRGLYVSARCWDSHPERDVLTEMRRDQKQHHTERELHGGVRYISRSAKRFLLPDQPLGAVRDQAVVDDVLNVSWNTVWDVRTERFDGGWSLEMSIPFKSLRYPSAGPQLWGVNFRRIVKWKNEYSYLTAMPASYGTGQAIGRMGSAGTLVGVETPAQSMNLELKPYGVSSVTTDNTIAEPFSNHGNAAAGFDFKYGLTRSLIADVTVNTDFAQVEEDNPAGEPDAFSASSSRRSASFFWRARGFSRLVCRFRKRHPGRRPGDIFQPPDRAEPGAGSTRSWRARVTGRSGRYSIGALNIETGDKASASAVATNFSTLRVKRDILRRSNIGLIATRRSTGLTGLGSNTIVGLDANFFLRTNVTAMAITRAAILPASRAVRPAIVGPWTTRAIATASRPSIC